MAATFSNSICQSNAANSGAACDGGTLQLFATARPNTPDDAPGASPLITFNLQTPAFGASYDRNPGGAVDLAGVPINSTVTGAGTQIAVWGRLFTSGGAGVVDGDVGLSGSGADFIISDVNLTNGNEIDLTATTIWFPETAGDT